MTEQEVQEKLSTAWHMPYGRAQIAAVEDVIRHADALGLAELQYAARMLATEAYTHGGEPAKAIVTFAWCLAVHDRGDADPGFDHGLHWQFKWMVAKPANFPEIPLDRAYAMLDDMEERYRRAGYTLNPVYQHRELIARHVGDVDTAEEQYRLWCATPRGEMSDCVGCEPTSKVDHLRWRGRDEDAVAVAMPVLAGTLTCVEQPRAILTALLTPYLRTGRRSEAAEAHRRAYRAIRADRASMASLGTHLLFCARTGNHARGLELVERHLGWLAEPPSPGAEMRFSAAAAVVARVVAEAGHADMTVRRPATGDDAPAEVTVTALHDELAARARALATRFDERNGTSEVGDLVAATLATEPVGEHLPLSGWARRPAPAPPGPALPDSPAELVELVREHARMGNDDVVAAAWQRFDELCPAPEPALLAARLHDRAVELFDDDPAGAQRLLERSADLYEQVGDRERALSARTRLALLWCRDGRIEDGVARAEEITAELMASGDDATRARAQIRLGLAYREGGRLDDALAAFGRARELADTGYLCGDAEVCTAQTLIAMGDEHHPLALEHADRAVAVYEPLGPTGNLRRAQFVAGQLHGAAGHLERAHALFGEAAKSEIPGLRGHALHIQGKAAMDLGRPGEACEALMASIAAIGPQPHVAYVKLDLGVASMQAELPEQAATALEEALPELLELGAGEEANRARYVLASAYRDLHQYADALPLLDEAAARCAEDGNRAGVGQMLATAADILSQQDLDAEAAAKYTEAADAYADSDRPLDELVNRREAMLAWQWAGETDRGLSALAAADALAATLDVDDPPVVWQKAMLGYDGARILANQELLAEATVRARAALTGFRAVESTAEAGFAAVLLGRLLADQDEVGEARELLTGALHDLPVDATGPREQVSDLLASLRS